MNEVRAMDCQKDMHFIDRAAALIQSADGLIVAAGAGMGVDSGLPDFRGGEGFWKAYPALARARIDFYRIASPAAFRSDPATAWGFYGHRLALYRRTVPHAGFQLLKSWGENKPAGYSVFTSNVDEHFQRAGFGVERVHECHGSIHHLQCIDSCSDAVWSAAGFDPDVDEDACRLRSALPACIHCGRLARPNVLMFDDWDWIASRTQAQAKRQEEWLGSVRRPVVIELGAGTAIPSVRHFTRRIVDRFGGRIVRINPVEPAVTSDRDIALGLRALEGLTAIAAALDSG